MDRTQRNLLIGAVVGALLGVAAAYYLEQNAEDPEDLAVSQNPMDWLRFGLAALAVGRQFSELLIATPEQL